MDMQFDVDSFWMRVKCLLKQKGITQAAAAKACGISFYTFRGWMSKGVIPVVSEAYILARYLGVSVEYLVSGRGKDNVQRKQL